MIERELGFGPGDEVNGEALASGQERVMNLQLFSRVRVGRSTADGRNVVEVDVEERWTLIPIPLAIATGDGYRVGGFFFESNLFGRNKNLAVGGFYSPQGSSVFGIYQDPGIRGSKWLLEGRLVGFLGPRERYETDTLVDEFDDRLLDTRLLLGYALGESSVSDSLNVYLGATHTFGRSEVGRRPIFGPAFLVRHNGQDFQIFANRGLRAEVFFAHTPDAFGSERRTQRGELLANLGEVFSWGHSLSLTVNGRFRQGDPQLDLDVLGGRPGSRGFRLSGLWGQRSLFGTAEYAVPVYDYGGTWAIAPFADAGVVEWESERTSYINPGLGFRFFLKDVAIPALGIDVVYNARDNVWRGGFAIGVSR